MSAKIDLLGTVTNDPQMRYTTEGVPVTNFTLVTKETRSKAKFPACPDGWKESYNKKNWELATFWRVACWRQQAEMVANYVQKGNGLRVIGAVSGVAVDGALNPRIWEGKGGEPRASFEITAKEIEFLPGKREGNGNGNGNGGSHADPEEPGESDDFGW